MTSVLSLSIPTSAQLTNSRSFLLLLDEALTAKKIDVDELRNFGGFNLGAMRRVSADYVETALTHVVSWSEVVYDFGSFTTAKPQTFHIVNDSIKYVQIGVYVEVDDGDWTSIHVRVNSTNYPNARGTPYQSVDRLDSTGNNSRLRAQLNMVSAPFPVSSGDEVSIYMYQAPAIVYASSYSSAFWIRQVQ